MPTGGQGRPYRSPSRPPSMAEIRSEAGRGSRPEVAPSGDGDPTHAWGAVSGGAAAGIAADEVEIPVYTDTLQAPLMPVATTTAPMIEPLANLPPVMSSGGGTLTMPVQGAPPPVQAAPMNGVGARPDAGPRGTRVMPAPQAVAQTTMPVQPAVVAPPPGPRKTETDWEPTPNFRKPGSPMLLWVILGVVVVGGVLIAGWQLLPGGTESDPVTPKGEPTAPVTSLNTSASPLPPPPSSSSPASPSAAPSARSTAGPAKSNPAEGTGKPKNPDKSTDKVKPPPSKTGAPIIGGPALF
jgi:hypothetical protein